MLKVFTTSEIVNIVISDGFIFKQIILRIDNLFDEIIDRKDNSNKHKKRILILS